MISLSLLLLLTVTAFLGLRTGSEKAFRRLGAWVLSIAALYFLLLSLVTFFPPYSTPVQITTKNYSQEEIEVYVITIRGVYEENDVNRFVFDRNVLQPGESVTRTVELDGINTFWTVGINGSGSVISFESSRGNLDSYNSALHKPQPEDREKILLAKEDIRTFNRERITRNILITLNVLLALLILIEMRAPKWLARLFTRSA